MDIDRSNYSYTFEEYESDVKSLRNTLSEIKNIRSPFFVVASTGASV